MYHEPTEGQLADWNEHAAHASDADEIIAEQRQEAQQEENELHAIQAVACPDCGARPGDTCDLDPPHSARLHAASVPCGPRCPDCPVSVELTPGIGPAGSGHWFATQTMAVADRCYRLSYQDPLALPRPGGLYAVPLRSGPTPGGPAPLAVSPGTTLLVDGRGYTFVPDDAYTLQASAGVQPPVPHDVTATAEGFVAEMDMAFVYLDRATAVLNQLHGAPAPGTPLATLTTARQRLSDGAKGLDDVRQVVRGLAGEEVPF